MEEYIQVITTTEKKEDAERIAKALVEKRLAGCVQIVGSKSRRMAMPRQKQERPIRGARKIHQRTPHIRDTRNNSLTHHRRKQRLHEVAQQRTRKEIISSTYSYRNSALPNLGQAFKF